MELDAQSEDRVREGEAIVAGGYVLISDSDKPFVVCGSLAGVIASQLHLPCLCTSLSVISLLAFH